MLTSRATDRFEIEHEPGNFATIRPLTWSQREDAREEAMRIALTRFSGMDDTLDSISRLFGSAEQETPESTEPLDGFHVFTILSFGLEGLDGPLYEGTDAIDSSVVDDLDHTTAEVIARRIITASRRSSEEGEV